MRSRTPLHAEEISDSDSLAQSERETARPPWRAWLGLIGLALLVKALIVGVALARASGGADPVGTVFQQWNRWDAPHYLYIATHGYATSGDPRNLIAFFPLYPALIAGLDHLGLAAPTAALVLSNLGGLLATILLFEIGRSDGDPTIGWRAAALFNIFPTAYFLFAGYTEGPFCALAFGAVLAARRRRFGVAGGLGALAAAMRLSGLALVPFLALEVYLARRWRRMVLAAASVALIPLGFLAYLGVNWVVLRDPFAFVEVQRLHWYHRLSPPWEGLRGAIQSISWRPGTERLTVGWGETLGGLSAYLVTGLSWLRLRWSDAAYATALTVLITFLPFWLSIPRYLLGLYPLFLLAGRVRNRLVQGGVAAVSSAVLLALSVLFASGDWAF